MPVNIWPPKPEYSNEDVEPNERLLTGNQWLDLASGLLAGLLSFPLLSMLILNPIVGHWLSPYSRNTPVLCGWLLAASTHCLFYFKLRRVYPIFVPPLMCIAVLVASISLFVIVIGWWL